MGARGLLAVIMIFTATIACACSCLTGYDVDAEVAHSSAVFVGTVITVQRYPFRPDEKAPFVWSEAYGTRVTLRVLHSWIGAIPAIETVWTGLSSTDCGVLFQNGVTYLVYARRQSNGTLATSLCSRSTDLTCAYGDIEKLDAKFGQHGLKAVPPIDFDRVFSLDRCMEVPKLLTPEAIDWSRGLLGISFRLTIGADGVVRDVAVVACIPPCSDADKIEAARRAQRWRFRPARLYGRNIAVRTPWGFNRPRRRPLTHEER